jgi:hypothetical protein
MAYEQKDMSGSVFNNGKKEKDTHPDRTGSCMIDGIEYWISGWVKKDKNGNPWMSLAFKRKDAVQPQRSLASKGRDDPISSGRPSGGDMDDQIPFAPEWR